MSFPSFLNSAVNLLLPPLICIRLKQQPDIAPCLISAGAVKAPEAYSPIGASDDRGVLFVMLRIERALLENELISCAPLLFPVAN